jgi:hypothetical protein
MVIHIEPWTPSYGPTTRDYLEQLADKRGGRELWIGKQFLGWSLSDTIILANEKITKSRLQEYVKHFSAQRHVIFESRCAPSTIASYITLSKSIHAYVFAFVNSATASQSFNKLKTQMHNECREVVTLRTDRMLQQLEVLLLSAPMVLGSNEPLALPRGPSRKVRASSGKAQKAA